MWRDITAELNETRKNRNLKEAQRHIDSFQSVEQLQKEVSKKRRKNFDNEVEWGIQYLAEI